MDLAPLVGVFTQPVTTSIYHFSVVNVKKKTCILNNLQETVQYIKQNMELFVDTVLEGEKKVSLSTTSHLSIFLLPHSLSHIPRVIPPCSCPPISLDPFQKTTSII